MTNDFSSIERLMEFGMSLAVAQQMVATMNHAIGNMAVPGAGAPIPSPNIEYFAVVDGAQAGPLSEDELRTLIERGAVTSDSLIWHRGLTAWKQAKDVPMANKWILLSTTK
jgi:hypothetical protein